MIVEVKFPSLFLSHGIKKVFQSYHVISSDASAGSMRHIKILL